MNFITEALTHSHDKKEFYSGKRPLDDYIKKWAKQDVKRRLAACFVYCQTDLLVKGYYTLSNRSIDREELSEVLMTRRLPYRDIPTTLLGRLAIDKSIANQGMGRRLLMDALKRSFLVARHEIGSMAVVVDPLDDEAIAFYGHFGFIQLPTSGKMFLPMASIEELKLHEN